MDGTEMEHGHSHPYPIPYGVLNNTVNSLNPSSSQVMSAVGNPPSLILSQCAIDHGNSPSYAGNHVHCHHHQLQHPASNHVTSPAQLPSSSMMRVGRNHHYADNTGGSCKGKNAVEVPGDCYLVNDVSNSCSSSMSFSLNSGMQNRDEPFEVGFNTMDATNFNSPEYRSILLPFMEGPQRSVTAPNTIGLQPESSFWHHHNHNHLFQGNYVSPTFQPGNTWVEQLRSNFGVPSVWNYPTVPCFEGRNLCAGSLGINNMGGHQGSSFGSHAFVFHSPSLQSQHQYLQLVQGMQAPNYGHHLRSMAPSYGLPVTNLLHHGIVSPSSECIGSVTWIPRPFPSSTGEWSYRPPLHLPQASMDLGDNRMRILSAQDNAVLGLPSFYGAENFFDQHRDMRLDIDNMSYEELLALEEQIGDVKTGLPEEAILKNLKTRSFCTPDSLLNSTPDTTLEVGTCIICQVEYVENERIGTLHCGHDYHADCVRQWLQVKNLCPICKTPALDPGEIEK